MTVFVGYNGLDVSRALRVESALHVGLEVIQKMVCVPELPFVQNNLSVVHGTRLAVGIGVLGNIVIHKRRGQIPFQLWALLPERLKALADSGGRPVVDVLVVHCLAHVVANIKEVIRSGPRFQRRRAVAV